MRDMLNVLKDLAVIVRDTTQDAENAQKANKIIKELKEEIEYRTPKKLENPLSDVIFTDESYEKAVNSLNNFGKIIKNGLDKANLPIKSFC